MSQEKLVLRPPPNVPFLHGYPGIPPAPPDRGHATVQGAVEVRLGTPPVKAKWVRVELRKVETLPGGGGTFIDYIGNSPLTVWQAQNEWDPLSSQDFPFQIRVPESVPPTISLERGAGIAYELVATVCIKGKRGILRRESSSPTLTKIAPIVIDKHELHSLWPIYAQPETRQVLNEGLTLLVDRTHTCYGPGDRVGVTATVKSENMVPCVLRAFEFALRELVVYRPAHSSGSNKKAGPQTRTAIIGEQKVPLNFTLHAGMQHKAELGCSIPASHTTATVTTARHIDIGYAISVKAILENGKMLSLELPLTVSNWPRNTSVEALTRIGPPPAALEHPSRQHIHRSPRNSFINQPAPPHAPHADPRFAGAAGIPPGPAGFPANPNHPKHIPPGGPPNGGFTTPPPPQQHPQWANAGYDQAPLNGSLGRPQRQQRPYQIGERIGGGRPESTYTPPLAQRPGPVPVGNPNDMRPSAQLYAGATAGRPVQQGEAYPGQELGYRPGGGGVMPPGGSLSSVGRPNESDFAPIHDSSSRPSTIQTHGQGSPGQGRFAPNGSTYPVGDYSNATPASAPPPSESVGGRRRRPGSGGANPTQRFTVVNLDEGTDTSTPTSPAPPPISNPGRHYPSAEEEKRRAREAYEQADRNAASQPSASALPPGYGQAPAFPPTAQTAATPNTRPPLSGSAESRSEYQSQAAAAPSSPPSYARPPSPGPAGGSSSAAGAPRPSPARAWPTAEEEKAALFERAQNAAQRTQARLVASSPPPRAPSTTSTVETSRPAQDANASILPYMANTAPTVSAGAALYSHAMSSRKSTIQPSLIPASQTNAVPYTYGHRKSPSLTQSSSPAPSASPPPPSITAGGSSGSRTTQQWPSAAEEKAAMRYHEAKRAVDRRQAPNQSAYGSNPIAYDALYPSAPASSAATATPSAISDTTLQNGYTSPPAVNGIAGSPSVGSSPPIEQPQSSERPPAFSPARGYMPPPGVSEKERMRLAFEAQDEQRRRELNAASSPPPPPSSSAPPPPATSATPSIVNLSAPGSSAPPAGPPPPGYGDAPPPPSTSGRSQPLPPAFTGGGSRPLTAAEEKARMKAMYEAQDAAAAAAAGGAPTAPPPVPSRAGGSSPEYMAPPQASATAARAPPSSFPSSSMLSVSSNNDFIRRDPSISQGKKRAVPMDMLPPPPPLAPKPPVEYIQETQAEDERTVENVHRPLAPWERTQADFSINMPTFSPIDLSLDNVAEGKGDMVPPPRPPKVLLD